MNEIRCKKCNAQIIDESFKNIIPFVGDFIDVQCPKCKTWYIEDNTEIIESLKALEGVKRKLQNIIK